MNKLYHFSDLLIKWAAYLSGILIFMTTIMTFYEVMSRAFFSMPTIWATELSTYAIIGSCFLGTAYAVRMYSHITVDLIINRVNEKARIVLAYISNALGLIFSIILTWYGFIHVFKTFELGVTSTSLLRIPMYLPESFIPIGGVLLVIAFILQLIDGGVHKGGDHL
ncbi:TRAP transporter small permease [Oceanobacillus sojae]|uniref:TRAP transporter small permease n=1 Tax=Oceanobacillus sojae TaxID=582851 RepID=UPI0009888F0F|nr:TRAP transporter small permease [Oceanobacillus sojae]MCT1903551.1 TRAP transporter small permease [Oceanobacillus sojae]